MHSRCASGIRLSDRLRSAVFGNVGSIVACRLGEEDAAILARQIGLATSLKLSDAGLTSLQGMPGPSWLTWRRGRDAIMAKRRRSGSDLAALRARSMRSQRNRSGCIEAPTIGCERERRRWKLFTWP